MYFDDYCAARRSPQYERTHKPNSGEENDSYRRYFPARTSGLFWLRYNVSGIKPEDPGSFNSSGAAVTVNGQPMGETPLVLDLKRKEHATLTIRAEGYDPYTTILQRKRGGWFWGDVLIGLTIWGLVSPIVDMATGAVYVLEPQSLNIKWRKEEAADAAQQKGFCNR